MEVTVTELRKNIYQLLDKIVESGEPLEINRKGKKLKIALKEQKSKLENLKKMDVMKDDPESYINIDWSKEWNPFT